MDYKNGLSDRRHPAPTPVSLLDENGRAVFGTFDKEFQHIDLMKIKDQSFLPDFMNWFRYSGGQLHRLCALDGYMLHGYSHYGCYLRL